MKISDLTANPRLTLERVRSETLSSLRPGQQVQARVISQTNSGNTRLQIGGAAVNARTPMRFDAGQRLVLEVVDRSTPQTLKLIRQQSPQALQSQLLRNALPKQLPIGRMMGQLERAAAAIGQAQEQRPAHAVTGDNSNRSTASRPEASHPSVRAKTPAPATTAVSPSSNSKLPVAPDIARGPLPEPAARASLPATAAGHFSVQKAPELPATPLMRVVQEVLGNQLSGEDPLTAGRLRQSLDRSGLFLEARLARGENPGRDLKANLLRLLTLLPPASGRPETQPATANKTQQEAPSLPAMTVRLLGELLTQAEAGMARVLVNQLASLPSTDSNQQVWAFDLPIRQPHGSDSFTLRITRDDPDSADGGSRAEARWSVDIHFDLPGLGPVSSRITLRGDEVSSHFAAERPDTVRRLRLAMPDLEHAFTRAGLKVANLSAGPGKADRAELPVAEIPRLLDEKA